MARRQNIERRRKQIRHYQARRRRRSPVWRAFLFWWAPALVCGLALAGMASTAVGFLAFRPGGGDPERYALALDAFREAQARLEADADAEAMYAYKIGRVYEKQNRPDDAAEQYTRQLYRALARPNRYGEDGTAWLRKTLTRLRAIETARGNQAGYETLRRRIRHAGLLATEP